MSRKTGPAQEVMAEIAPVEGPEDVLLVDELASGYGDLRAVWNLSLKVRPGEITALLGANGAGKTTSLLAILGLTRTYSGRVVYCGNEIQDLPVHERVTRGIALVQEGKRVFRELSVDENLRIGGWSITRPRGKHIAAALGRAYDRFPLLAERRHVKAGQLSGGQQQLLAIAQALMPNPKLLMLDEPSAGLAPVVMDDVLMALMDLRAEGYGILLVEQLLDVALSVADEVVVMARGRVSLSTRSRDIADRGVVERAYLA